MASFCVVRMENDSEGRNRMDDEERLISCQREIRRLRSVVRQMEADERQYEKKLKQEITEEDDKRPGLMRALELWQEI